MTDLFTAKDQTEIVPVNFDFTLPLGAATISTAVVDVSVLTADSTAADATPNNLKSGSAIISGKIVSQKLTGGVVGVTYHLRCTITTSDAQTITKAADIAVIAA